MIEVAAGTALSPHVERDATERSSEAVYVSKIHRKVSEIPCYQCVNQRPLLSFYNDRASSNDGTFMLTQELSPSLACVVGGAQISRARSRRVCVVNRSFGVDVSPAPSSWPDFGDAVIARDEHQ